VVLRVLSETRTRHLPHRGPRRLTRLFAHCSLTGKTDFSQTDVKDGKKETNKGHKELNVERKQQANPTIKECSYDSAALHKHWNETRSHEIKYVTSDLFQC